MRCGVCMSKSWSEVAKAGRSEERVGRRCFKSRTAIERDKVVAQMVVV